MSHPSVDRLRDRLSVNGPYEGALAEAYDTWIPVDEVWPDEVVYRGVLGDVEGPILELGCGAGRPLLRWLADGLDVHGLDASADMLSILRRHAAERGLQPTLHHADLAPLALGEQFGAIVCMAGTFMLIDDQARAEAGLESYFEHLRPGGIVGFSLGVPDLDDRFSLLWRLRRTGTDASGTTFVVHEAVHADADEHLETVYNRIETYDIGGRLVDTMMRRHRLRWWERAEFEAMLTGAGFRDAQSLGDETGWVTIARRP